MVRRIYCEALEKELVLPDRCERIISFSPAVTEALFLMGLGDKIVGVSAFCVRPAEARSKQILGSYASVNKERIASLKPDIIFTTTGYQRDFAKELAEHFNVFAIPLPLSLAGIINFCFEAGMVAGYYDEARRLERFLMKELCKYSPSKTKLRVYIEIDFGIPVTFGAYSYITDSINFLGHESIFQDEHREWLESKDGLILDRDPDVVIYEPKMFRSESKEEVLKKFGKRGLDMLRAIREGRLYITPGPYDFLAHHGPSFITEVLPWLQRVLEAPGGI